MQEMFDRLAAPSGVKVACAYCDGNGHRCDQCDGEGFLLVEDAPQRLHETPFEWSCNP